VKLLMVLLCKGTYSPVMHLRSAVPDHTPIAYLLSTSLTSCNLKHGFRRFVPQIMRNNNQFSTQ